MRNGTIQILGLATLLLGGSPAWAGNATITDQPHQPSVESNDPAHDPHDYSTAWHRKGWEGSFDRAADASGDAAKKLESVDFACRDFAPNQPKADPQKLRDCQQAQRMTKDFAAQAGDIQSTQNTLSIVSKASDVAAVGAVGATIYSELALKGNTDSGYDQAAHIQKKAGEVNYATGAADLAMGAYAYVAQKNKLENMKSQITGNVGNHGIDMDSSVTSSVTNAAEAAKSAAYSHMLYGAGKMAAGYASMYLAKRSAQQAENMRTIDELTYKLSTTTASGVSSSVVTISNSTPNYVSNTPTITVGSSDGASTLASNLVNNANQGVGSTAASSSGASVMPMTGSSRAPASASKPGAGGGSGASTAGGNLAASADQATPANAADKAKETMGSSFEMQLTGGAKPYAGSSGGGDKSDLPNLSALLGGNAPTASAATGLSPSQMYREALDGGAVTGDMSGVSSKNEVSLFDLTRQKLTKMFQTGNVGIPKNVEVKD